MTLHRNPRVVSDVVDGKAVLVDPAGREIITLNPLGTYVWDALAGSPDLGELCRSVGERYPDVPGERIATDVRAFLDELTRLDLVTDTAPGRG